MASEINMIQICRSKLHCIQSHTVLENSKNSLEIFLRNIFMFQHCDDQSVEECIMLVMFKRSPFHRLTNRALTTIISLPRLSVCCWTSKTDSGEGKVC